MEFGVLGPLRVAATRRELAIGSRTQRIVLASLLARTGEVVSTAALIDAVWGDDAPPSALNTLRSQVSRLRRLVGERLVAGPDGYALRPGRRTTLVDAGGFDRGPAPDALRPRTDEPGAAGRRAGGVAGRRLR